MGANCEGKAAAEVESQKVGGMQMYVDTTSVFINNEGGLFEKTIALMIKRTLLNHFGTKNINLSIKAK